MTEDTVRKIVSNELHRVMSIYPSVRSAIYDEVESRLTCGIASGIRKALRSSAADAVRVERVEPIPALPKVKDAFYALWVGGYALSEYTEKSDADEDADAIRKVITSTCIDSGMAPARRTRVYVAGPYTKGDVALNVRDAVKASDRLLEFGYAPYCPHLTHFWHMLFKHGYQTWLDLDNEWVACCDALLRIPGESAGADKEVALAESLGIPVFFSAEELRKALPPEN